MIKIIILIYECGIAYVFNTIDIAEQNVSNSQSIII